MRLVVLYWGVQESGKTYNALTFPHPISFHNFDLNEEHLAKMMKEGVWHHRYGPKSLPVGPEEASRMLNDFYSNVATDLPKVETGHGTMVIDTLTSYRQLLNKVVLDEIEQKRGTIYDEKTGKSRPNPKFEFYPFDYARSNEMLKNVINVGKNYPNVNIVLTAQAKEVYNEKGRPTGTYEAQVPEMAPYLVQLSLHCQISEGICMASVDKWSFNKDRLGEVLADPTYKDIIRLVEKDVA